MNKYFVKIPYCYTQYANLTGFVYAEDKEEAEDLAADNWNIHDQEHEDSDSSGDSDYDYAEMSVTLEESDIPSEEIPERNNSNPLFSTAPSMPNNFLEDLPLLATL